MYLNEVRQILIDALALDPATTSLEANSALLGSIPELDSMGVLSLIGALESRFNMSVDDDEISAESFATLGSLAEFVARKAAASRAG